MAITPNEFRNALSHFASGVTIVTVKSGEDVHGLTVSAFVSISPDPPLIAVAIDRKHSAYEIIERPDAVFAVSILRQEQAPLSDRFAWVKDENRFLEGDWKTAETGAPVLADAAAWLDCRKHSSASAGTHNLYVGEVQAASVPTPDTPPLIYWNRSYRRLQSGDAA
ncbi:MAG: flavin reductase family protein [Acidobacteriota bacterium]